MATDAQSVISLLTKHQCQEIIILVLVILHYATTDTSMHQTSWVQLKISHSRIIYKKKKNALMTLLLWFWGLSRTSETSELCFCGLS